MTGGPCVELAGTRYADEAEYHFCPVLNQAMPSDRKLMMPGTEANVEAEIAEARERAGK
jgi:hypothetical protein